MFRSLGFRSIPHRALVVGIATLLTVTAGALPRASSGIDLPIPITDPAVVLQVSPIEIPMPVLDPFIS